MPSDSREKKTSKFQKVNLMKKLIFSPSKSKYSKDKQKSRNRQINEEINNLNFYVKSQCLFLI